MEIEPDNFIVPDKTRGTLEYFKTFFSDDIIYMIVDNTNLYSTQQTGKSVNTNFSEVTDFLAIELLMGIFQLPAYTDYWAQATRIDKIANIMPLKRYQALRRYLHFVQNDNTDDDRYFKIRPVLEKVWKEKFH